MLGAGGEPVDFRRTLASHGVADLPPNRIDEEAWTLELTLPLARKAPRTVRVSEGRKGYAKLEVIGRAPGKADLERLRSSVAMRGISGHVGARRRGMSGQLEQVFVRARCLGMTGRDTARNVRRHGFGGPLTVRVGKAEHAISRELAAGIGVA